MNLRNNWTELTDQNHRWFTGKTSKWPQFWNRLGFAEIPNLSGKRLLDVGSGLGANSYAAAKSGAQVTALEIDSDSIDRSKQLIQQKDPKLFEKTRFENRSIEQFDDPELFDYIICDEVFEHLIDFRSAIDRMADLLTADGLPCSGWGPLWHSPAGGHEINPDPGVSKRIAANHDPPQIVLGNAYSNSLRTPPVDRQRIEALLD